MQTTFIDDTAGTYSLLMVVAKDIMQHVGRLGSLGFQKGFYSYTGSAMGSGNSSLRGRISRHLAPRKKVHWHIDRLLSRREVSVLRCVYAMAKERMECRVNSELENSLANNASIRHFGSSDCKSGCSGHLLFLPVGDINHAYSILHSVYLRCGLKPRTLGLG